MLSSRWTGACIVSAFIYPLLLVGTVLSQSLVINEFLSSNNTGLMDEDGERNDWIEIYNPSTQPVNLQGYSLTDDFALPQKWIFPSVSVAAKGFLLIWASSKDRYVPPNLHTNFKLEKSGERIGLYNSSGNLVDNIVFGAQVSDVTYGRYPDGMTWTWPLIPTPRSANRLTISPPQFSIEQGFYSNPLSLVLTSSITPSTIRYTLDGSNPELNSPIYSNPIAINSNTIVRAATFIANNERSFIITKSYFINETVTTPVISLVVDPDSLYNSKRGIYTNYDSSGANWERPAHVTFFDQNRIQGFDEDCGIRIHGSASRVYPKKSFRIYFRADYGVEQIEYPLFPDAGVSHLSRIVLHAGGQDQIFYPGRWELFKNAMIRVLGRRTNQIAAAFRMSVIFLNGQFWGVYTLRERVDNDYIEDHYGYEDMDLLEGNTSVDLDIQEGSLAHWYYTYNFFNTHYLSNAQNYQEALTLTEIENFKDYMIINSYSGNHDWPQNGFFMFRQLSGDIRWRWIIWDCDHTFANYYLEDVTLNSIKWIMRSQPIPDLKKFGSPDRDKYIWATLMLRRFMANSGFKNDFLNRFADILNTNLSPQNATSIVDSLAGLIRHEIPREFQKWGQYADPYTTLDWETNVAYHRDYVQRRPDYLRQYIVSEFGLAGTAVLTLGQPQGLGTCNVNSIAPSSYPWQGVYFKGITIKLEALAASGYRLVGWSDSNLPVQEKITLNLTGNYTVHPIFEVAPPSQVITLPKGWNLISSYIQPDNLELPVILRNIDMTILKDQQGQVWWPALNINTIGPWDRSQGYYFHIPETGILIIYGQPIVPESSPISVAAGWNIISYLRNGPMPITSALATILSDIVIVKNCAGGVFWPLYDINSIGDLSPDQGYQIYMQSAATLLYPPNSFSLAKSQQDEKIQTRHFKPAFNPTGHSAHLLLMGLPGTDGVEIGVFTKNGLIVGSGLANSGKAMITVWGDDAMTADIKEGAVEDELLCLKRWHPGTNQESAIYLGSIYDAIQNQSDNINDLRFHRDAVWVTHEKAGMEMTGALLSPVVHPNPFNNRATISIHLPDAGFLKVSVYNIKGQLVRELTRQNQPAGMIRIPFDGRDATGEPLSSGLYLVQIEYKGEKRLQKFTILK